MITMTCLMGVRVSVLGSFCAFAMGAPRENWRSAREVKPLRSPSTVVDASFFKFIQMPPIFLLSETGHSSCRGFLFQFSGEIITRTRILDGVWKEICEPGAIVELCEF